MGGEISVESTVGTGSAFVVWLPAAPLESLRTGGGA
jgi:signal transduction histidine kinase